MALNIQMSQKQSSGSYEDLNPITLDVNVTLSDTTADNLNLSSGSDVADGLEALDTPIGEIRVFSSERDDLGSDYLLCDGSFIETADYPELDNYLNYEGATWTSMGGITFSSSYGIKKVAYGNGVWVAVGDYGRIYYSTNGTSWTKSTVSENSSYCMYDVVYANNKWVTVGSDGKSYYSTNGISWTAMTGVHSSADLNCVGYANGRWVCVPLGVVVYAYYSSNGTSWHASSQQLSYGANTIAYGNNRWVIGNQYGYSYYSTNGISWTAMTGLPDIDTDYGIYKIVYADGRWVAVGELGHTYYSTNGTSWTAMTGLGSFGAMFNMRSVAYADGRWVAVGELGHTYYSTNGTSWTAMTGISYPNSSYLYDVVYANNKWVTVGSDGKSYYSTNGISWTAMGGSVNTDYDMVTVASSGDRIVMAGEYGRAYQIFDDPDYTELPTIFDEDNQVYGYIRALD